MPHFNVTQKKTPSSKIHQSCWQPWDRDYCKLSLEVSLHRVLGLKLPIYPEENSKGFRLSDIRHSFTSNRRIGRPPQKIKTLLRSTFSRLFQRLKGLKTPNPCFIWAALNKNKRYLFLPLLHTKLMFYHLSVADINKTFVLFRVMSRDKTEFFRTKLFQWN